MLTVPLAPPAPLSHPLPSTPIAVERHFCVSVAKKNRKLCTEKIQQHNNNNKTYRRAEGEKTHAHLYTHRHTRTPLHAHTRTHRQTVRIINAVLGAEMGARTQQVHFDSIVAGQAAHSGQRTLAPFATRLPPWPALAVAVAGCKLAQTSAEAKTKPEEGNCSQKKKNSHTSYEICKMFLKRLQTQPKQQLQQQREQQQQQQQRLLQSRRQQGSNVVSRVGVSLRVGAACRWVTL